MFGGIRGVGSIATSRASGISPAPYRAQSAKNKHECMSIDEKVQPFDSRISRRAFFAFEPASTIPFFDLRPPNALPFSGEPAAQAVR